MRLKSILFLMGAALLVGAQSASTPEAVQASASFSKWSRAAMAVADWLWAIVRQVLAAILERF